MSEDAVVGKTVTVYDESLDESNKGVIDDYYPGRGYRKLIVFLSYCIFLFFTNIYFIYNCYIQRFYI